MIAVHHENPRLVVHAVPGRDSTPLDEMIEEFAPEPELDPVHGELEFEHLVDIFPRTFHRLPEWGLSGRP